MLLAFLAVPLAGGSLRRLADLRLRWIPLAAGAFAIQILIVNVIPEGDEGLRSAIHIATYAVLGGVLLRNLGVPGMPLIALGGLSNALVIVANGGVMPASAGALRTAGLTADPEAFTNSALVEDPNLWFLGDVFAVPSWVPWSNVFSVGDLLLILGGWVLVHRICGSRLVWRRRRIGPALVLFDAAGLVEAVTPEAGALLADVDGGPVASAAGVRLPPEAFVVAGRARTLACGRPSKPARAEIHDRRGRPLTLTASCFDAGDGTRLRTALAITG